MEIFSKMLIYLGFKKNDNPTDSVNLKIMHGINRISIYLFIVCLGLLLWKLVIAKMI